MKRVSSSQPITTILFDLDDTLLDSWAARLASMERVFREAGVVHVAPLDFILGLHGQQIVPAFRELTHDAAAAREMAMAYRRYYWLKEPGLVHLFPGVDDLVRQVHGQGLKIGVVTQKEREFLLDDRLAGAAAEIVEIGLGEMVGITVGYEDVTRHKPDPEGVHLALHALGATPEETLFIGDSPADMLAAQAAGCWSCHATWGLPVGFAGLGDIVPHVAVERPELCLTLDLLCRG